MTKNNNVMEKSILRNRIDHINLDSIQTKDSEKNKDSKKDKAPEKAPGGFAVFFIVFSIILMAAGVYLLVDEKLAEVAMLGIAVGAAMFFYGISLAKNNHHPPAMEVYIDPKKVKMRKF